MQTSDINPLVRRSALRCLACNLLVRRSALRCLVRVAGLPLAAGRPHEALDVGPRVVELEADVEPHVDEARRQAPAAPRCLAAGRTVVRQGHGHDAARRDEHHVVEGVDDRLARLVQDADDQLAATVDQRINYRSHRQRRMMYLFSFVKPLTYTYTCCTRTCTYLWPPTLALVRITSYSS